MYFLEKLTLLQFVKTSIFMTAFTKSWRSN